MRSSYHCQSLFFGAGMGTWGAGTKWTSLIWEGKKGSCTLARLLYYSCLWLLGFIFIHTFAICISSIVSFLFKSCWRHSGFCNKEISFITFKKHGSFLSRYWIIISIFYFTSYIFVENWLKSIGIFTYNAYF